LVPEDGQAAATGRQFQPVGAAVLPSLGGLGCTQPFGADLEAGQAVLGTQAVPVGLIKGGQAGIGLGTLTLENRISPCLAGVISPRALDAGRPSESTPPLA